MKTLILVLAFLLALPAMAQDCSPEVLRQVSAVYPDSAKVKGIEGTVWVDATISKDGFVVVAMVQKSDNQILNEAALDAIVRWQFKPLPQECRVTIPIKFKLKK